MKPLDIAKLLKLNPKVDPDKLVRPKKRSSDGMTGNPASPYRGRRAVSDDRMNWTEISPRRAR